MQRLEYNNFGSRSVTWDVFRTHSGDNSHADDNHFYEMSKHVMKVFLYGIIFCLVLTFSLITTGTLLFATSNIIVDSPESDGPVIDSYSWTNEHFPLICVDYKRILNASNPNIYTNYTNCVAIPRPYTLDPESIYNESLECIWPCNRSGNVFIKPKQEHLHYETEMCDYVSVQWVWCLYCMTVTPYFFTFFRCLWYMAFKTKKSPKFKTLVIVSIVYICLECLNDQSDILTYIISYYLTLCHVYSKIVH